MALTRGVRMQLYEMPVPSLVPVWAASDPEVVPVTSSAGPSPSHARTAAREAHLANCSLFPSISHPTCSLHHLSPQLGTPGPARTFSEQPHPWVPGGPASKALLPSQKCHFLRLLDCSNWPETAPFSALPWRWLPDKCMQWRCTRTAESSQAKVAVARPHMAQLPLNPPTPSPSSCCQGAKSELLTCSRSCR